MLPLAGPVYVGLGSNLGDPEAQIHRALTFLASHPELTVRRCSRLYLTPPMGPPQPHYLNAVAELNTALLPLPLLRVLKDYEWSAGRRPGERWGPRIIDLDLLLMGEVIVNSPALTLPHPGLAARSFVLEPLAELNPDLVPPGQTLSVAELLARLSAGSAGAGA